MNKEKTQQPGDLQVDVIPAKARYVNTSKQLQDIRVAAYCRVSTGDESQQTSYTKQKAFYTELINGKKGWRMAGIYADEARSGTSREHRQQFNQMMSDAQAGKIDYIITKSISRFARNTVDTLECVRKLQRLDPPVGIYFEKENIDTLNSGSEMFLTLYSSIAQEESRSISENIRWSFQKNFKMGRPVINLGGMIGYDKGKDDTWVVNEKQAETVRFIFHRFIHGDSGSSIARQLNQQGKRTVNGRIWRSDAVYYVLRNEKYVGDLEMQKTVTESFLTHKSVKNRGQAPRYYVYDHHAPIVDRLTWQKARVLLGVLDRKKTRTDQSESDRTDQSESNRAGRKRGRQKSPFHIMKCGACKKNMTRMTYRVRITPSGQDPEYVSDPVWKCCREGTVREMAQEQSFMELMYRLKRDQEKYGQETKLVKAFEAFLLRKRKEEVPEGYAAKRLALLDMQLKDPGESPQRIQEIREEKEQLLQTQSQTEWFRKNFELFLNLLQGLPETNPAGQPLHVRTLDPEPPDLLEFDRGIFCAVIEEAAAWGDIVHYTTNFGLRLTTDGNSRGPDEFVEYRICPEEGPPVVAKSRFQLYQDRLPGKKQ